jgi:hypothetical protein
VTETEDNFHGVAPQPYLCPSPKNRRDTHHAQAHAALCIGRDGVHIPHVQALVGSSAHAPGDEPHSRIEKRFKTRLVCGPLHPRVWLRSLEVQSEPDRQAGGPQAVEPLMGNCLGFMAQ